MNKEEIERLTDRGVPVLDYYKEDTVVLIEGKDLKELLDQVIQTKLDGNIPVVVIEEGVIRGLRVKDHRAYYAKTSMLYRNIRMLTRHVEIVKDVK